MENVSIWWHHHADVSQSCLWFKSTVMLINISVLYCCSDWCPLICHPHTRNISNACADGLVFSQELHLSNFHFSFPLGVRHYSDAIIMSTMPSQITGISIVYSTICSDVDQRKHQISTSLAFVRGIHRWPVNSPYKGPVTWKMSPFDDVIMTSCFFCCFFRRPLLVFHVLLPTKGYNFSFSLQPTAESIILQMAPSIEHQCRAMLSLLEHYNWHAFSIVTGAMAGDGHFVNSLRELSDASGTQ